MKLLSWDHTHSSLLGPFSQPRAAGYMLVGTYLHIRLIRILPHHQVYTYMRTGGRYLLSI